MNWHVLVSLLKSLVLLDKVKVVSADDNGPLHLHFGHHSRQDAASDAHIAGEGTLLVNVCALWGLKHMFKSIVNATCINVESCKSKQCTMLITLEYNGLLRGMNSLDVYSGDTDSKLLQTVNLVLHVLGIKTKYFVLQCVFYDPSVCKVIIVCYNNLQLSTSCCKRHTSLGVLKPSPTLFTYLVPFFFETRADFLFRKTLGCFWNDLSVCNWMIRLYTYEQLKDKTWYLWTIELLNILIVWISKTALKMLCLYLLGQNCLQLTL